MIGTGCLVVQGIPHKSGVRYSQSHCTAHYHARFTTLAILAGFGSVFFLLVKPPVRKS